MSRSLDVLQLPFIGRLLRHKNGRLWLQLPMTALALLLIYDGFTGSIIASQNLATVSTWIHYRGLVVLVLLLAGNWFCMACPFTLTRTLAKHLSLKGRRFPRFLRNKWLAIFSLLMLFFAYEWLNLWSSPLLTAWIIVGYFALSFALEAFFTESAFCKYVCPLGTFNFVYSTLSPTQITAKETAMCASCVGKECINGSYSPQPVILIDQIATHDTPQKTHTHDSNGTLGCGTLLFVPQLKSNLDCTLCLDCVRACPHNNIALGTRPIGQELIRSETYPKRWDVAFLLISMAFIGVVNAFGMVPPVYDLIQSISHWLNFQTMGFSPIISEGLALFVIFVVGGLILPIGLSILSAQLARWLSHSRHSTREIIASLAPAFLPLGFGIWVAHYSYHFLTGFLAIIPTAHFFLVDHGISFLGQPNWALSGIQDLGIIGAVQFIALLGGFLGSFVVLQHHAERLFRRQSLFGMIPFALVLLGLMLCAIWIFSLPMEMRGTIFFD